MMSQDPLVLLEKKRQEVQSNKQYLEVTLEKEINSYRHQLDEFEQQLSSDPMSADQVRMLDDDIQRLQDAVDELSAQRDAQLANSDGRVRFMRQRVIDLEKKNDAAKELLKEAEEERKDTEEELARLEKQYADLMGNGDRPSTDAEVKQFVNALKQKNAEYKQFKAELHAGREEIKVLNRTEALLRSRAENVEEMREEAEREHGVEGATEAQENLESISKAVSSVDQDKGAALTELSQVVARINDTLAKKSKRLAPQIAEMQQIRGVFAKEETKYRAKKQEYDNTMLTLESDRAHLDKAIEDNLHGWAAEESNYHFFNCHLTLNNVKLRQMEQEAKWMENPDVKHVDGQYATYREQYDAVIRERANQNREMRMEQKNIGDSQENNVLQRNLFINLKKLLTCKRTLSIEASEKSNSLGMDNFQGEVGGSMENFAATGVGERMSFD